MLAMEEKACITSAQKCIAKKIPVRIWITKSHPNNESKFLEKLILVGDGRSIIAELMGENIGFSFLTLIKSKVYGLT